MSKSSLAKALKKSVDIIAPVIDEGTLLRIGVPLQNDDYTPPKTTTYTYAGLYVNNKWYLTGYNRLLNAEYATTADLLTALARYPGSTVDLATEFDTIR